MVKEHQEHTGMEAIVDTIGELYGMVGFNHLLGALDTFLIRHWDACLRDPLTSDAAASVAREIARLKKARLMLTKDEYTAVREKGILWTPTQL